jgi:hypothetical protein
MKNHAQEMQALRLFVRSRKLISKCAGAGAGAGAG